MTMFVCTLARLMTMRALAASPFCQDPGVGVVVGKSLDVMIERVEPCGGEDADLAHGPAEHPPVTDRTCQQVVEPASTPAPGCAQSLRQCDGYEIERRGQIGQCPSRGHGGVPQASPIEEGRRDPVRACGGAHTRRLVLRKDHTTRPVMSVFDLEARVVGGYNMWPWGFRAGQEFSAVKVPRVPISVNCTPALAAPPPVSVPHGVALTAHHDIVAGARQDLERHLVGHGSRRQPERRRLADERRNSGSAAH